jgi:AcrR family transcriptional regulator
VKSIENPGRRARKKQALRDALIDTAYSLFEKNGFDGTRIEDITDEVDISTRTFFRYFSSKEDVVLDYQEVEHDEIMTALRARPQGEPVLTSLRRAAVEVVQGCEMGLYGVDSNRFKVLKCLIREHPLVCAKNFERTKVRNKLLIEILAERMQIDPLIDIRPGLVANVLEYANCAAYGIWQALSEDRRLYSSVLDEVFGALESGLNYPCPPPISLPGNSPT